MDTPPRYSVYTWFKARCGCIYAKKACIRDLSTAFRRQTVQISSRQFCAILRRSLSAVIGCCNPERQSKPASTHSIRRHNAIAYGSKAPPPSLPPPLLPSSVLHHQSALTCSADAKELFVHWIQCTNGQQYQHCCCVKTSVLDWCRGFSCTMRN